MIGENKPCDQEVDGKYLGRCKKKRDSKMT